MADVEFLQLFLVKYESLTKVFGSNWHTSFAIVYAEDFDHAVEKIKDKFGHVCAQNFENLTIT